MLFNVEYDHGEELAGYLVPDGYSEVASYVVIGNGGVLLEAECDSVRDGVLQSRRHETGKVGFLLDESVLPGLVDIEDLEIRDSKTDILIYRRESEALHIPHHLFRLETQLAPRVYLDKSLAPFFQYSVTSMQNFGHETNTQLFHLNSYHSRYLSGRVLMKNYEQFIGKDLLSAVSIQEPHYELALRVLLFSQYEKMSVKFLSGRDEMTFQPAIEYFSGLDINNEKQIRQAIRHVPREAAELMSSPVVKQLVTKTPDERVTFRSVAQAIEMLSRFDLVTFENGPISLSDGIADMLGLPSESLFDAPRKEAFCNFAKIIEDIDCTDLLLESDLIMFHHLKEAIQETTTLIDEGSAEQQ